MMFTIVVALLLCQRVFSTEDVQNKTKRTVGPQLHNYGDRPVMLYTDSTGSSSNYYGPVPPELPKQVAAQQVLYEFQQTPTNAYSNVHVNQYYQPAKGDAANTQNQFINEAESVAAPVQHSALIRHGQNVAQVQYNPQPQAQSYAPGKYLYVNGRIIYQPNQHIPQPQFKPVASYQFNNPYPQLPQKFVTPTAAPQVQPQLQNQAWGFRRFQPPQPHQIQQITKPMPVAETTEQQQQQSEEQEEEADEEEPQKEVLEENDYDEESEDDDDSYYGKYRYEDDDEEHEGYSEDDEETGEDEDNERGSSRQVAKKQKKKNGKGKYNKGKNYKYSENYSSSSKYDKPWKQGKKYTKPKTKYMSVKFSKVHGGRPKVEKIEGRQSQNVPVIHKQKIVQQKWYVTKSTDDTTETP